MRHPCLNSRTVVVGITDDCCLCLVLNLYTVDGFGHDFRTSEEQRGAADRKTTGFENSPLCGLQFLNRLLRVYCIFMDWALP